MQAVNLKRINIDYRDEPYEHATFENFRVSGFCCKELKATSDNQAAVLKQKNVDGHNDRKTAVTSRGLVYTQKRTIQI